MAAFERIDLVQDVSTTSGTTAFVPAGTPPQGMQAFSVHTVGATLRYRAFVGAQWEIGTGTWNGTNIARSVRKSSNGNALVNFSATPTIMEVVDAADVAAFLTAADGTDVTTLAAAGTIADADSVLVIQGGTLKLAAASVMRAYYSAGGTTTTAPVQTITVATPATQTVGTQFPVTGTFANSTPTALDYRLSDDTAGVWTAAPSPTINAGAGTFTFNLTPTTASAGRTISVRDRTTLVSGTSGSYVVNAAATGGATDYIVTLNAAANPGFPTAQSMGWTSGEAAVSVGVPLISIKTASNQVPDSSTLKFVMGKSSTVPPMAYADSAPATTSGNGNTSAHGNAVTPVQKAGSWVNVGDSNFGVFKNSNTFFAWGTPTTVAPNAGSGWYQWVLSSAGWSKVVCDANGVPVQWVLS